MERIQWTVDNACHVCEFIGWDRIIQSSGDQKNFKVRCTNQELAFKAGDWLVRQPDGLVTVQSEEPADKPAEPKPPVVWAFPDF